MHSVVTQYHKINFKSATFAIKLRACRDETRLGTRQSRTRVLKPGSCSAVLILAH